MKPWMIYGANGYTGTLIAQAATAAGHRPILAGRNRDAVGPLARKLGLEKRIFPLLGPRSIEASLEGIGLVLNCAGPFVDTTPPLLAACLEAGAHYLDITGEIEVFAHCHARHEHAQSRGIVILPGVGFDVIPSDCVSLMLKHALPRADELILSIEAEGGPSPGTARTGLMSLGQSGRVRIRGKLQRVPLAWKTRSMIRDGIERQAVTIPWGDLYTAWVSTGIPNIETYLAMPPHAIRRLRRLRWIRPLLRVGPLRQRLEDRMVRGIHGPDDATRAATHAYVTGEVHSADGGSATMTLQTPNGYTLTASAALASVEHVLAMPPAPGYYTPAQALGAEFVLGLPGVHRIDGR